MLTDYLNISSSTCRWGPAWIHRGLFRPNAAVQMFVNRCLLNLEESVSPSAIDNERWEWMKHYRVWEANRKVFLNPENFLEPEWRNDRSEFFKELESHLVQNDITRATLSKGSATISPASMKWPTWKYADSTRRITIKVN